MIFTTHDKGEREEGVCKFHCNVSFKSFYNILLQFLQLKEQETLEYTIY